MHSFLEGAKSSFLKLADSVGGVVIGAIFIIVILMFFLLLAAYYITLISPIIMLVTVIGIVYAAYECFAKADFSGGMLVEYMKVVAAACGASLLIGIIARSLSHTVDYEVLTFETILCALAYTICAPVMAVMGAVSTGRDTGFVAGLVVLLKAAVIYVITDAFLFAFGYLGTSLAQTSWRKLEHRDGEHIDDGEPAPSFWSGGKSLEDYRREDEQYGWNYWMYQRLYNWEYNPDTNGNWINDDDEPWNV